MTLVDVALIVGFVWRLTRLAQRDTILDQPRAWLDQHTGGMANTLLWCPWCLSVWIAAPVVIAWPLTAPTLHQVAVAALASAVTGQLLTREET